MEITPKAMEITPKAMEITPKAMEITPKAWEIEIFLFISLIHKRRKGLVNQIKKLRHRLSDQMAEF